MKKQTQAHQQNTSAVPVQVTLVDLGIDIYRSFMSLMAKISVYGYGSVFYFDNRDVTVNVAVSMLDQTSRQLASNQQYVVPAVINKEEHEQTISRKQQFMREIDELRDKLAVKVVDFYENLSTPVSTTSMSMPQYMPVGVMQQNNPNMPFGMHSYQMNGVVRPPVPEFNDIINGAFHNFQHPYQNVADEELTDDAE